MICIMDVTHSSFIFYFSGPIIQVLEHGLRVDHFKPFSLRINSLTDLLFIREDSASVRCDEDFKGNPEEAILFED